MLQESHDASFRKSVWASSLIDTWVILTLLVPIIGTFYPPETYFIATGFGSTDGVDKSVIMAPLMVIMTLFAGAMIFTMALKRRFAVNYTALAFIVVASFSLFQSTDAFAALNRLARLLPITGFAVLYAQYYSWHKVLRLTLIAFLISTVLSVIMALFFPSLGLSHLGAGYETAWRGALIHKNGASVYALGALFAIDAMVARYADWRLAMSTLLLCIFVMIMSESATALVSLVVTGGLYVGLVLLLRAQPAIRFMATAAVFMCMAVLGVATAAFPDLIFGAIGRDATMTGRTDIWAPVWQLITLQPLTGYGYSFWLQDSPARTMIWKTVGYQAVYSHNTWLDLWLQIGIFGLLAVAFDLLIGMARGFKAALTLQSIDIVLPTVILFFFLIRSISEVQMTDPGTSGVYWLFWSSTAVKVLTRRSRMEKRAASYRQVGQAGRYG